MPYELKLRRHYWDAFEGSQELFELCWRKYRKMLRNGGACDPTCDEDVDSMLEALASVEVNNPRSPFWLKG